MNDLAFARGFIKRAMEYGYSEYQGVALYKQAVVDDPSINYNKTPGEYISAPYPIVNTGRRFNPTPQYIPPTEAPVSVAPGPKHPGENAGWKAEHMWGSSPYDDSPKTGWGDDPETAYRNYNDYYDKQKVLKEYSNQDKNFVGELENMDVADKYNQQDEKFLNSSENPQQAPQQPAPRAVISPRDLTQNRPVETQKPQSSQPTIVSSRENTSKAPTSATQPKNSPRYARTSRNAGTPAVRQDVPKAVPTGRKYDPQSGGMVTENTPKAVPTGRRYVPMSGKMTGVYVDTTPAIRL